MKAHKHVSVVAGLSFATAFTLFACSGDNGDTPNPEPSSNSVSLCAGEEYDPNAFRCEANELIGKCRGQDYYFAYQVCNNGVIEERNSGGSSSGEGGVSSSSVEPEIFGYCDYGYDRCFPMTTDDDQANCDAWGNVVNSCSLSSSSSSVILSSSSSGGGNVSSSSGISSSSERSTTYLTCSKAIEADDECLELSGCKYDESCDWEPYDRCFQPKACGGATLSACYTHYINECGFDW